MSVSRKLFIENLENAGVLSEEQVRDRIAELPTEQQPIDGDTLADLLIQDGTLTSYQAEQLNRATPRNLRFGNYQLVDILGRGGMGTVYKAVHTVMKHEVAIKVISQESSDNTDNHFKRFQREVQAVAKLSHDNIVSALDAGEEEGKFFLVMELVHGDDLGKISKCEGKLPVHEVIDYVMQTAVGLKYAHQEGIVHRDIKPHNLLLSSDGMVKILDLGLVSLQRSEDALEDSLTGQDQIIGTIDYMSPEQAKDVHAVDARTDIYSLGCTLFRLLTGVVPYQGKSAIERLLAHRDNPIPSLHDFRSDVPELLDQIFQRMVAKEPEDRYQTMEELLEALETCRLANATVAPTILTDQSPLPAIEEFTLDLDGNEISTVEIAREEVESINTSDQPLPAKVKAVPTIASGQISETITRTRRFGRGNSILVALAILILAGVGGALWYTSRPGYVEVDFPIEYREGRWEIEIRDKNENRVLHLTERDAEGFDNSNPIKLSLDPGAYTYYMSRPPFFPNKGRFTMDRGKTILIDGSDWETSDLQELGLIGNDPPDDSENGESTPDN